MSTADIAPTIASLAGLLLQRIDGRDISQKVPAEAIYGESEYSKTFGWSGLTSIRGGNLKLIRGAKAELFDLSRDPAERTNILEGQRRAYSELNARLDQIAKTAVASTTSTVDEETRSKLASLGYVAPAVNAKPSNRDPRDMAPLFRRYEEAQRANAIPRLEQLVREDPSNSVFRSTLARAYKQAGAIDRALPLYRQAVTLAPSDPDAWYNLAAALQEGGHAAEAKQVASEAERLAPNRAEVHNVLGIALVENGDAAGAEGEFRKAIALDPRNARSYNNIGNIYRITGRPKEAAEAYRNALQITPAYPDALNGLGVIAVQQGDAHQAIQHFDAALRIAPRFYEARLNRAIAMQLSGDNRGASKELQMLIRDLPPGHAYDAQRTAARTLLGRLGPAR